MSVPSFIFPAKAVKCCVARKTARSISLRSCGSPSLATKQLGFDPRKKSRQDAAACLARREKGWAKVWNRFEAVANGYESVVSLLRLEEPHSMVEGLDAYPRV